MPSRSYKGEKNRPIFAYAIHAFLVTFTNTAAAMHKETLYTTVVFRKLTASGVAVPKRYIANNEFQLTREKLRIYARNKSFHCSVLLVITL